ncbi:MAG: ABC transporter ATP-binding protein [Candidatus Nanopelagicaceae bacterium]|nr:ABC transporter ATP-binding protein [Candidatus Nanopelagicaceae bacterium]
MSESVSISNLKVVRDKKTIIPNLSMSIGRGIVAGLLGPSGSGKTTIFRSIVGVQRTQAGTITVLDQPAGAKDLRTRIGYFTQSASIYSDLTCLENLHYFAHLLGDSEISVEEIIDLVDLRKNRKQIASSLSGGERARLALATALLGKPELLILDEPTVGLDPVLRRDLWDLFHRLADQGKTLLISSHVMDEADRCDILFLLRDGRVLASGTPQGLKEQTGKNEMEDVFISLVEQI